MPVGFITEFPTTHPDLIEQFTATNSGDIGSLISSGANINYDANGVQIALLETDNDTLAWDNAFVVANDLASGFTVQFEIEKGLFAESVAGQTVNQIMFTINGSNSAHIRRDVGNNNWRVGNSGSIGNTKTIDTAYRSHVVVTLSFDPSIGSFGGWDFYADFLLLNTYVFGAAPGFSDTVNLSGSGGTSKVLNRYKNIQLFNSITTLTGVNEKEIGVVGDSWTKYGQYQLGGDTNNGDVALEGWQTEDYADSTLQALTTYKNRSYFAELQYQLILQGIYPKNNRIQWYGRGGTAGFSTSTNPLSERVDAALAGTGASGPPWPDPGLGTGAVDIWINHTGTNDRNSGNPFDDVVDDIEIELQRMLDDGAELVVTDNVARVFDSPPVVEIDEANVTALNTAMLSLSGLGGKTVLVDMYTGWTTAMSTNDGVHPNSTGQIFWAQQDAAAIQAFFADTGSPTL